MTRELLRFPLLVSLVLLVLPGCGDGTPLDRSARVEAEAMAGDQVIAARVGDRVFTMEEVDSAARAASIKPFQELYEARKSALEQMIAEHLLDSESSRRGITRDEMVQFEVDRKIVQLVHARYSGQACSRDRGAMVRAGACDDLLLLRSTPEIVVEPDQFDLRLIGIAT